MRFLPVFLDLAQGAVGLAGSGPAAQSKLRLLRRRAPACAGSPKARAPSKAI